MEGQPFIGSLFLFLFFTKFLIICFKLQYTHFWKSVWFWVACHFLMPCKMKTHQTLFVENILNVFAETRQYILILLDMLIFSSGSTDHKTYDYIVVFEGIRSFFWIIKGKKINVTLLSIYDLKNKTTKKYIIIKNY